MHTEKFIDHYILRTLFHVVGCPSFSESPSVTASRPSPAFPPLPLSPKASQLQRYPRPYSPLVRCPAKPLRLSRPHAVTTPKNSPQYPIASQRIRCQISYSLTNSSNAFTDSLQLNTHPPPVSYPISLYSQLPTSRNNTTT